MSEKKFELPKLPEFPPKGFGLGTGRAGERRAGTPRTEAERAKRHAGIFGSNPGVNIEDFLPAPPPDLPLPKFLVEQMKKK